MERITDRGIEIPALISENEVFWLKLYEKLTKYEDLEEEGLLVVLPCKVGDDIFEIVPKCKPRWNECPYDGGYGMERCNGRKCGAYIQKRTFRLVDLYNYGKTVFRTREEAEAKLKEYGE